MGFLTAGSGGGGIRWFVSCHNEAYERNDKPALTTPTTTVWKPTVKLRNMLSTTCVLIYDERRHYCNYQCCTYRCRLKRRNFRTFRIIIIIGYDLLLRNKWWKLIFSLNLLMVKSLFLRVLRNSRFFVSLHSFYIKMFLEHALDSSTEAFFLLRYELRVTSILKKLQVEVPVLNY